MSTKAAPHPADLHVGARLRLQRKAMGMSQTLLAGKVGLTFQQLQKYERGINRISASKLFALSHELSTSIDWFFEGMPDPNETHPSAQADRAARAIKAFSASPEGLELAEPFAGLPASARRRILDLCRALADEDGTA